MTDFDSRPAAERGVASQGRVYLRPLEPRAASLDAVEVLLREPARVSRAVLDVGAALDWATERGRACETRVQRLLEALRAPRPKICGLALDRPLVMAVLNVTPDSFSDGGDFQNPSAAIRQGRAMAEAGADIVDVGGESTRPGSRPVEEAEELARAIPVVEALAAEGITVSIDTRKAAVMRAALRAGAKMINDVSALRADAGSLAVAADHDGPVVLMHMLGTPETMQQDPHYDCAPLDIFDFLEHRMAAFVEAGIARERLIVDPGIGFGKTIAHNLEVLRDLAVLHGLGCPLMVGASRKGFIGRLSSQAPPKARLPGSLACALHAASQGAHIVRVHDVAETVQALNIWRAVRVGDFQQHESSC